jgi:hypothetical protein
MSALMAVAVVCQLRPAMGKPADIFAQPAPVIGSDPPQSRDLPDGDVSVATQTGSLNYSYPVKLPPGRNGMAPSLSELREPRIALWIFCRTIVVPDNP